MLKRKEIPEQITMPPMPKPKKFGTTSIKVITALDGCADNCPKFKIKTEVALSIKDKTRPTINIYKCEHADDCYRLAEILNLANEEAV